MKRLNILLFDNKKGFRKLSVTEKQLKLLSLLHEAKQIEDITFFDMREISPIDERVGNYLNIGNMDFSFCRVLKYFKEPLFKIRIIFKDEYQVTEYVTLDRLEYLKEDSKERQEYVIEIE